MPDTIGDVDEHPIIFNEWSIQRILAGEKTQTRRVIDFSKLDPLGQMDMSPGKFEFEGLKNGRSANFREPNGAAVVHCPYGQPGDVLWCREAFRLPNHVDGKQTPKEYVERGGWQAQYDADGSHTLNGAPDHAPENEWGRLRPAIHMPRELCRLCLRVEDVRVERVQEIEAWEALDEGISPNVTKRHNKSPREAFQEKWNDIHGNGAWERNDWVWVVEFSRINE
mgnify:FL=1